MPPMIADTALTRRKERLRAILHAVDDDLLTEARPELSGLVSWRGGQTLPIHRWMRYREGFSPALIRELALGQRILDPFAGSGSIMLGAAQMGRSSVGIDVNPLAAFAAETKLTPLSRRALAWVRGFRDSYRLAARTTAPWPRPGLRIVEKVFEEEVITALLRIRALIEGESPSEKVRRFLKLAWVAILEDVGSYFKEGNGIKYRNRKRVPDGYVRREEGSWQLERFGENQAEYVFAKFDAKLDQMLVDSCEWLNGAWSEQEVIEGNSIEMMHCLESGSFDSIIFSPPYANRFDYFESQKVELWFGGFVQSYEDMLALRKRSMRSHLGADLSDDTIEFPELEQLIGLLDPDSYAVRMRVPTLLRGYFSDMHAILASCRRVLREGGACHVVVGNSAYAGVIFPSDTLIARIACMAGFESARVTPVRHLTVAPQQRNALRGYEHAMRESIVTLS